ncbi:MAG: phosphate acyltransferase, partial [Paracoccus sp. (in: a-proteobacteria)]|nr:phosphate acyltransferase [Paracoccus sp. (in: a-proteobacteria)]
MSSAAEHDTPPAPSLGGGVVISVDAMGGDRGPATVIAGIARSAEKNPDIRFIVHGPEAELSRLIAKRRGLRERCVIRHAGDVVTMNDKPSQVIRNAQGTSMWSAVDCVRAGEATVAVSCGNTGALMAL